MVEVFVSPDSMVLDQSSVISWNRFANTVGNPLCYSDPTGHCVFDTGFGGGPSACGSGSIGIGLAYAAQAFVDGAAVGIGMAEVVEALDVDPQDVESMPLAENKPTVLDTPLEEHDSWTYVTEPTDAPGSQVTGFPLVQQRVGENVYQVTNNKGAKYPSTRVKGYGKVPFPTGDITDTDPAPLREQFTAEYRQEFRQYWYDTYEWYPSPDKYDIHHILPLSKGGTNDYDNLVPLERGLQHNQFTKWWLSYP
ncbi:MAG: HNH endonuclease signature motif containing protein [Caldilineaceae bacterium]